MKWMKRCYEWLEKNHELPVIIGKAFFPIIQGGVDPDLRKQSIEQLIPYAKCVIVCAMSGLAVGDRL